MKMDLEFDFFRFFDASSPGHGGLFSKNEELSAFSRHKALPEAAGGHRRICRIDSLGPFSESAPAALLGSFFSVRAGNVSFLKRDPHGRALWYQRPHFMKFHRE
jgi:hypothetical protein